MLEASISALIPTEGSEEFYRNFYNRYNFVQVNDILLRMLTDNVELSADVMLGVLEGFNEDQQDLAVYSLGAGIMNPALMRRRKENRGISTELFVELRKMDISPLEWYMNAFEFLMLYSVCEQSIKEYILSVHEVNGIQESNIIEKLFEALGQNLSHKFLEELSESSSEVLKSKDEVNAAWRYYTVVRHGLVHSGGFITRRLKKSYVEVKARNARALRDIFEAMFWELDGERMHSSLGIVFRGKIVNLSSKHLNFFRNMTVMILESIERAIHPDEYALENFNPLKL